MLTLPKHFLFLTTNNLGTNPRLVKEVQTALGLGYRVTVVLFKLGNWSDTVDVGPETFRVHTIKIDATIKSKYTWLKWGLLERIARFIYPWFKNNLLINTLASSRRSLQILRACTTLEKPNLIIAHNLAAAYPASKLSQKWHVPFIFDLEDYHPGENIKHDAKKERVRREYILKTLLPKAVALTSASPLIGEQTLNLIGGHINHRVILNSFPEKEFFHTKRVSNSLTEPLKLVWFSQKISFGRGIEQLFDAIIELCSSSQPGISPSLLSFTLIGNMDIEFYQQKILPFIGCLPIIDSQIQNQSSIVNSQNPNSIQFTILAPMSQRELHHQLANYDVGLALEFDNTDLNRQLCLTNKIIAYSQAGLYILATDTPAQKQFICEDPKRGEICGQNDKSIAAALVELTLKLKEIKKDHVHRYNKGKSLTWEKESLKLSSLWATL